MIGAFGWLSQARFDAESKPGRAFEARYVTAAPYEKGPRSCAGLIYSNDKCNSVLQNRISFALAHVSLAVHYQPVAPALPRLDQGALRLGQEGIGRLHDGVVSTNDRAHLDRLLAEPQNPQV